VAVRHLTDDIRCTPADYAVLLRLRRAGFSFPLSLPPGDSMSDDSTSALVMVTPPASEPVTLSQAKAFLRIDSTADDDTITTAITAARQFAEHYLRAVLLPQSWDFTIANPCDIRLTLPLGPAQSITSITLRDEAGDTSTMDSGNYTLAVDGFHVYFSDVPQTERLTVHYSAYSYANTAAIPAPILQGILHHIVAMVENRDGIAALPIQSVNCYQPYRRIML
jgi:uncharacterized phiE125 gp8 family phage protein